MGVEDGEKGGLLYTAASNLLWAANRAVRLLNGSATQKLGWDPYLQGAFSPQREEVLQEVEVIEGELPPELAGCYLRTGPNPKLDPLGGYHWFDGDGMIHAVRIADGKASYCNRWVQTSRLQQEGRAGWPLVPKIGDSRGASVMAVVALRRLAEKLGVLDSSHGTGTANTAVAFHAGRVLALHEGDLPYALSIACNGLVETIGRCSFGGKIGTQRFTAHPKTDPQTGEMYTFAYSVDKQPYCWFGVLDREGRVAKEMPVPLPEPIMMHDCALTQNYVLLLDVPLVFDPKVMIKEGKLPFVLKDRPMRIGVVPRTATSADEIRWFASEPVMCFHTCNAWEEGGTIKLFLCTFPKFSLDTFTAKEGSDPVLSLLTIDLDSGATTLQRMDESAAGVGDFPAVPPSLVGRPTRYAYIGNMRANDRGVPEFVGITKFDLQAGPGKDAVASHLLHGGARLGGEAVFVPRPDGAAEDDGYLMTYVTDTQTKKSELVVYDAATMSAKPVARLRMPHTVPFGFHGGWVTGEQLAAQGGPSVMV
ncbi:hypothetical protein ABPG75_011353 [Micractinium tetrahymenae]